MFCCVYRKYKKKPSKIEMQKKIHCITMKPKIDYPCRVMARVAKSSLFNLDGVQNRLVVTLQSLWPQTQSCKPIPTLTLFSMRYLDLLVQTFITRTCYTHRVESPTFPL